MDYEKGYVYELMESGGPTYVTEPYFKEAVDEMMRARTLCSKANACMPDDPTYVTYLEELFGRKLEPNILTISDPVLRGWIIILSKNCARKIYLHILKKMIK